MGRLENCLHVFANACPLLAVIFLQQLMLGDHLINFGILHRKDPILILLGMILTASMLLPVLSVFRLLDIEADHLIYMGPMIIIGGLGLWASFQSVVLDIQSANNGELVFTMGNLAPVVYCILLMYLPFVIPVSFKLVSSFGDWMRPVKTTNRETCI